MCRASIATLLVVVVGCTIGCASAAQPANRQAPAPLPKNVELVLGKEELLQLAVAPRGNHEYQVLQNGRHHTWVLWSDWDSLNASLHTPGARAFGQRISPPQWKSVNHFTAVLDATGNPVVVWSGSHDRTCGAVAASTWTGSAWSAPAIIDNKAGDNMTSLLATTGEIHVVYDRKLDPPEEYARGFIIVDGEFPDKCFHAVFNGKEWCKPRATTGRGRFYVDPTCLSNGADGKVVLSMEVHPFGISWQNAYLGRQIWNGKRWTGIERVSPQEVDATLNPALAADRRGAQVAWWRVGDAKVRCEVIEANSAAQRGTLELPAIPVLASRPSGGVVAYWREDSWGRLRLWTGTQWTAPVACVKAEHVSVTPDGRILLSDRRENGVFLQEILVKGDSGK